MSYSGSATPVLRDFPAQAKRTAGYELMRVQSGLDPADWKPMSTVGPGVREIRVRYRGQFRIIYIANRSDGIFVLHAFQKNRNERPEPRWI